MILPEKDYKKVLDTMPVVCVDGLIINSQNQYLLVKRNNEPLKGEFWLPGGRLHKNELLETSIKRKIFEELGTEVSIVKFLGYFEEFFDVTEQKTKGGFHAISFVFLLKLLSDKISLDNQASEWRWFDELPIKFKSYNLVDKI